MERKFLDEWLPLNVVLGRPFQNKINSIDWIVPKPQSYSFFDVETCVFILRCLDYGRTRLSEDPGEIFSIVPKRGAANTGLTYLQEDRCFLMNKRKDELWTSFQEDAYYLATGGAEKLDFRWDQSISEWQRKIVDNKFYFINLHRTDTGKGAWSPRVLWNGQSNMYCFERYYFKPVHEDIMYYVPTVPRHHPEVLKRMRLLSEIRGRFISVDYSRWDLSIYYEIQKTVFMALAIIYDMPEEAAALIAAYNICGPLIHHDEKKQDIIAEFTCGNQHSGAGCFVDINNTIHLLIDIWMLVKYEGYSLLEAIMYVGMQFGDNGFVRTSLSAESWALQVYLHFGLLVKSSETGEASDEICFLRKLSSVHSNVAHPLLMSVVRRMACPRTTNPTGESKIVKAQAWRAQLLSVAPAALDEPHRYRSILQLLNKTIKREWLLPDLRDEDLSLRRPYRAHEDSLVYVKAYAQILGDSMDLIEPLL
jgi:hypothetical protein